MTLSPSCRANPQLLSRYSEQLIQFTSLSSSFLSSMKVVDTEPTGMGNRTEYLLHLIHHGYDIHNRPYSQTWKLLSHLNYSQIRVYSCLQSLMKMHGMFDQIIAEVCHKFPSSFHWTTRLIL